MYGWPTIGYQLSSFCEWKSFGYILNHFTLFSWFTFFVPSLSRPVLDMSCFGHVSSNVRRWWHQMFYDNTLDSTLLNITLKLTAAWSFPTGSGGECSTLCVMLGCLCKPTVWYLGVGPCQGVCVKSWKRWPGKIQIGIVVRCSVVWCGGGLSTTEPFCKQHVERLWWLM